MLVPGNSSSNPTTQPLVPAGRILPGHGALVQLVELLGVTSTVSGAEVLAA
jgi:hypothetical protein